MSEPMPREERKRLAGILDRVEEFTKDLCWHSLSGIAYTCGCSEATASARLRDLRNLRGYQVDKCKHGNFYWYRVTKPIPKQLNLLQENQDGHP